MRVEIVYSRRRKKTLSASLEGEKIKIRAPKNISQRELEEHIKKFEAYFRVKKINRARNLLRRAQKLNSRYFGGRLKVVEIKFVTNQKSRYGSCSPKKGVIRLSSYLLKVPEWVLDYVIIHELAHLEEPNHSKRFWELVSRYKLTERARGYLLGLAGGDPAKEK